MDLETFLMTRWYFILGHAIIALIVMVACHHWRAAAPILALWLMELGQAKDDVPGSVKDPSKWLDMIVYTFDLIHLVQWALPGLVIALTYSLWRHSNATS